MSRNKNHLLIRYTRAFIWHSAQFCGGFYYFALCVECGYLLVHCRAQKCPRCSLSHTAHNCQQWTKRTNNTRTNWTHLQYRIDASRCPVVVKCWHSHWHKMCCFSSKDKCFRIALMFRNLTCYRCSKHVGNDSGSKQFCVCTLNYSKED